MSQLPPADAMIDTDLDAELPPTWPKAVGIVSICWASLSLGCMGCGVLGVAMQAGFGGMMAQAFPDGMPPQMTNPPMSTYIGLGIGFVNSLLLLVAGIILVMRNPVSRMVHLVYAVLSILGSIWGTIIQMQTQAELAQWCRDHPSTKFAISQSQSGIFQYVGLVVGVLLGVGYPLFCLVWFGWIKKNPAEYSRGLDQLT